MQLLTLSLCLLVLGGTTEAIFPAGWWIPIPIPSPSSVGTIISALTCPTGCCIKGYCMAPAGTAASSCTVTGTTAGCAVSAVGTVLMPACFNAAGTGCAAAAISCRTMAGCATACPTAAMNVVLCPS